MGRGHGRGGRKHNDHVGVHHQGDQGHHLRLPAEGLLRLARIAEKQVHLRGPEVSWIHGHRYATVAADALPLHFPGSTRASGVRREASPSGREKTTRPPQDCGSSGLQVFPKRRTPSRLHEGGVEDEDGRPRKHHDPRAWSRLGGRVVVRVGKRVSGWSGSPRRVRDQRHVDVHRHAHQVLEHDLRRGRWPAPRTAGRGVRHGPSWVGPVGPVHARPEPVVLCPKPSATLLGALGALAVRPPVQDTWTFRFRVVSSLPSASQRIGLGPD